MMDQRWLWRGLLAWLLAFTCSAAPAAADQLQFDVPVASFCVDGDYPIVVSAGGDTFAGTLAMGAADASVVAGELAIGAEIFTLTGKQKAKKGVLHVALKGTNAAGAKVSLKGVATGSHLVGTITGKLGGAKLPTKSTFDADLTGAPPFAVRCELDVTIDEATGAVVGSGLARVCGGFDFVTVTGSTNLPKAIAKNKKATGKLKITGELFKWSGKGEITQASDGSLGFLVDWKGKGLGVASSGRGLLVVAPLDGPSPGRIALPDAIATRFNPLTLHDVVLTVTNATPSTNPVGYTLSLNGDTVEPGLVVDAQQGTLTLGTLELVDGRNDIEVLGTDATGLVLNGVVTIWAGLFDLTVTVHDTSDQPVAGAQVELMLGDDQRVTSVGTSDANGNAAFSNIADRTVLLRATAPTGPIGGTGIGNGLGGSGTIVVKFRGFDPPSAIDNNDFATGDASGWNVGASATIVPHVENVGPSAVLNQSPRGSRAPLDPDVDLAVATGDVGTSQMSRTFTTEPDTVAVTVRYRFVTSEVPGGYFGTKYNDAFSVSIRSQAGGGEASEVNTMNGLGLGAFDGDGATSWREVTLPVATSGDVVQVDATVTNVADEFFDSIVLIDKVAEVKLDLVVSNATRVLLDTNRFEITVNPPGSASNFKVEIRRANGPTAWFTLGTQQVIDNYKHRVAGKFKLRGHATVAGKDQLTPEKDLEVQFPDFAKITADANVKAFTDAAFATTKAATTQTSRREEGFGILLDTNVGAEKYIKGPTAVGTPVPPQTNAGVDFDNPPDNPKDPSPIAASQYCVASFHTHTPSVFRPFARQAGPTPEDHAADTKDDVTGVVYDYVGVNGLVPAKHPLDSPAKLYQSGPSRRSTPP